MTRSYVYVLADGDTPRYVGYTSAPDGRKAAHYNEHPDWSFVLVAEYPSEARGYAGEAWWITRAREAGYPLVNVSGGRRQEPDDDSSPIVSFRMPADLIERIKRQADEEERTVSSWLRLAIRRALEAPSR